MRAAASVLVLALLAVPNAFASPGEADVARRGGETRVTLRKPFAGRVGRTLVRALPGRGAVALAENGDAVEVLFTDGGEHAWAARLAAPATDDGPAALSTLDVIEGDAVVTWLRARDDSVDVWVDRVRVRRGHVESERRGVTATGLGLAEDSDVVRAVVATASRVVAVDAVPWRRTETYRVSDNGYLRVSVARFVPESPVAEFAAPRDVRTGSVRSDTPVFMPADVSIEARGAGITIGFEYRVADWISEPWQRSVRLVQFDAAGEVVQNREVSQRSDFPYPTEFSMTPVPDTDRVQVAAVAGQYGGGPRPISGVLSGGVFGAGVDDVADVRLRWSDALLGTSRIAAGPAGRALLLWRKLGPPPWKGPRRIVASVRERGGHDWPRPRRLFGSMAVDVPAAVAVSNARERFVAAAPHRRRGGREIDRIVVQGIDERGRTRQRRTIGAPAGRVHELAPCDAADSGGRVWMLWSTPDERGRRRLHLSRLRTPPTFRDELLDRLGAAADDSLRAALHR